MPDIRAVQVISLLATRSGPAVRGTLRLRARLAPMKRVSVLNGSDHRGATTAASFAEMVETTSVLRQIEAAAERLANTATLNASTKRPC